jgi:cytochrome c-type biogenesis protein CcmE
MSNRAIIGLILMAGFAALLLTSLATNSSVYADFKTAQKMDQEVHIVGQWVKRDQYIEDKAAATFSFYVKDTSGNTEFVYFNNPKPANFETAERILLVGKYHQGKFVADKILMKCPSKYNEKQIEVSSSNN